MLTLIIPEMTCAHCVKTISNALSAIDENAKLAFDLPQHRLDIDSLADPAAIMDAIAGAGYMANEIGTESKSRPNGCGACAA